MDLLHKNFKLVVLLLACTALTFTSCKKDEEEEEEPATTGDIASWTKDGTSVTATTTYVGIFNDNGTVKNTLTLTAPDDSEVTLRFNGTAPTQISLTSLSDAYWSNPSGTQHRAISGTLNVTEYSESGSTHTCSGTFSFTGVSSANNDTVQITSGSFTDADNLFD